MEENSWLREPLGDYAGSFYNNPTAPPAKEGHARALLNWERMTVRMRHGAGDPTFCDGLSGSQHNSFRLLSEWWMGSIQEDFLSQAAQRALKNAGDFASAHSQYLDVDRKLARLTESTYHKEMFMLFQLEFVHEMRLLQTREHKTFLGFVQAQRERCAQYASLQRVAHSFLRSEVIIAESQFANVGVGPTPVREIPLSPPLLSQIIPACIESYPWLRIRESIERSPYYLWDVVQKKTVKTEDLQSKVAYVCVSHTWGRYRERKKPAIQVPGAACIGRAISNAYRSKRDSACGDT
jgi:hypothetical protein